MNKSDIEIIQSKIYVIPGLKVMLDRDLAELYGVETKVLNQAVKRNMERFPEDFMFQLIHDELKIWMSQIVTSNKEKKGLRKLPFAFTQNGIAILSSVLSSDQAETYQEIEKIARLTSKNKLEFPKNLP